MLRHIGGQLGLAAVGSAAVPLIAAAIGLADLIGAGRRGTQRAQIVDIGAPSSDRASLIILNWNGRHLLERGVASALAALREGDELIVVDNGSTDDSVAFVRATFPSVRVVELPENLYFSAGNNAGVHAARNDVVVLLNSDMVVEPDFLTPLVSELRNPEVFAATAQILPQDPDRRREETGRTTATFMRGALNLAHLPVAEIDAGPAVPVLWAGGGSSAYHRRKFLALGGLDELYRPAYVEDLALSYAAWKRGWSSVLVAGSRVHHAHRATSRRVFGDAYVDRLIARNQLLFIWRYMGWRHLSEHLAWLPKHIIWLGRRDSPRGAVQILGMALTRLPRVALDRARDRSVPTLNDAHILVQGHDAGAGELFDPQNGAQSVKLISGWHDLESGHPPFRWMRRRAECWVDVEQLPAEIQLRGVLPRGLMQARRAVRVRLSLERQVTSTRRFTSPGPFSTEIRVQHGPKGWRRLTVEIEGRANIQWAQKVGDQRELAAQVVEISLRSRSGSAVGDVH